jgi:hypothetical protein
MRASCALRANAGRLMRLSTRNFRLQIVRVLSKRRKGLNSGSLISSATIGSGVARYLVAPLLGT